MAVRSMARSIPQDENAVNPLVSAKTPLAGVKGNNGVAAQERKKLSNITNKLQPFSSSASGKGNAANLSSKLEALPLPPKGLSRNPVGNKGLQISSAKNAPSAVRTPLRNITNENEVPGGASPSLAAKPPEQKNRAASQTGTRVGSNTSIQLSEELVKKAEMWAQEGIERVHFSGKDMELLREKMEQEEMEKRIAAALAYRTDFPSFLPHVSQNVADGIGDVLKIDPYEEIYIRLAPLDAKESFEDISLELNIDNKNIPPIPHDWHMVRDDVLC
ncbi:hypothetical protein O6H91_05G041000 [Diphasiastrum complanatum]|uniref:Uncharacterized protein n=1 Tax=Diphasiastrum complanatum TaxID=34168 RepID=A0ACC2DMJ1_DIPCM|nr:hypothetical protein O6H91_05G041000 [Diphasiastrum complanatum]